MVDLMTFEMKIATSEISTGRTGFRKRIIERKLAGFDSGAFILNGRTEVATEPDRHSFWMGTTR